jgi:hypothetical protein
MKLIINLESGAEPTVEKTLISYGLDKIAVYNKFSDHKTPCDWVYGIYHLPIERLLHLIRDIGYVVEIHISQKYVTRISNSEVIPIFEMAIKDGIMVEKHA